MIGDEKEHRDLAALVVPAVGSLLATGSRWEPYRLIHPVGVGVQAATDYFRDLQAAGRTESTVRSYGMDLLRWFRFLWVIDVPWDRATRLEARDFCRWLLIAGRPVRPHWRSGQLSEPSPNPGQPYAASARAHNETVVRCFYTFHLDIATGPILVNPFPLDRSRRSGRVSAHHNPMEPHRKKRTGIYRPRVPTRVPRSIPDEEFNEKLSTWGR